MKHLSILLVFVVLIVAAITFLDEETDVDTEFDAAMEAEEMIEEKPTEETIPSVPAVQKKEVVEVVVEQEEESTCGKKNDVCKVSNDCCRNLSLECQEVTLSSGVRQKRCMPFTVNVCTIECEADGTWGRARSCGVATLPAVDTPDCGTLTGACDPSSYEVRSTRKCWRS